MRVGNNGLVSIIACISLCHCELEQVKSGVRLSKRQVVSGEGCHRITRT